MHFEEGIDMAIFKTKAFGGAGVEFAALDIEALAGYDFWRATSKSVRLYDDAENYTLFSGSGIKFKQSGSALADVTAGTVTGLDVVASGTKMLSVTHLTLKAAKVYDYFEANDARAHWPISCPATTRSPARNMPTRFSAAPAGTRSMAARARTR